MSVFVCMSVLYFLYAALSLLLWQIEINIIVYTFMHFRVFLQMLVYMTDTSET